MSFTASSAEGYTLEDAMARVADDANVREGSVVATNADRHAARDRRLAVNIADETSQELVVEQDD
jgi:hypothetical protein